MPTTLNPASAPSAPSAVNPPAQKLPFKIGYKWNFPKAHPQAKDHPDEFGTQWVSATSEEHAIEVAKAIFQKHWADIGLVAHSFTIIEKPFS